MYSDEQLKEWEDNPTPYEDSQRQRAMERDIRKTKRELAELDKAIKSAPNDETKAALEAEFRKESVRLKSQEEKMKSFCKEKDLLVQSERAQVQGFGRSQAQKAVHAEKHIAKLANSMYDIGNTEENIRAYYRDLPLRRKLQSSQTNKNILPGRQNIHVVGTKEYHDRQAMLENKNEYGPCYITISFEQAHELVKQYCGTGIIHRLSKDKTRIEAETITSCPHEIGIAIDNRNGASAPTTVFRIHCADNGVHIIPDYPSKKGAKAKK